MLNQQENHSPVKAVHSFQKTSREQVQFTLRRYRERYYADVRVWYSRENESNFRPTRKGICLPVEHLEEVKRGLSALQESIRQPDPASA